MHNYQNHEQEYYLIPGSLSATLLMCCIRCQDFLHIHVHQGLYDPLYHAYVYLEFLIFACTIYILAPLA